eukprot:TRINITY_DN71388_c0_g1_i1.p1 TRINITY_DN71388_c0_g1~~TRINITY_DN71388_c0_g1_i1.p1  ORF type:complete len:351 (+),score=81.57 TRINITY_DN71388_c0_g1_i1:84-1136(+)
MEVPSDNLFVTNLPVGCDENMVRAVFGQFGNLMSVRVLGNPGKPGGSPAALVRYSMESEATAVLNQVNGQIPPGFEEAVYIKYALQKQGGGGGGGGKGGYGKWNGGDGGNQANSWGGWGGANAGGAPSSNLYIKGLPSDATEELVTQNFSEFGKVVSVKLLANPAGEGSCACLVRFEDQQVAQNVVDSLNGQQPEGFTQPLIVKFANNPASAGGGGGWGASEGKGKGGGNNGQGKGKAGGKGAFNADVLVQMVLDTGMMPGGQHNQVPEGTLYIAGLPGDTTKEHLYALFAPFGAISSAYSKTGGFGEQAWAIGFVNFLDPQAAQTAIVAYNGMEMPNGQTMKVVIKTQK